MDPPDSTDTNIFGNFNSLDIQYDQNDDFFKDLDSFMKFSDENKETGTDQGQLQNSDEGYSCTLDSEAKIKSPELEAGMKPSPDILEASLIDKLKQQNRELRSRILKQECELSKYEERLSEKMDGFLQLQMERNELNENLQAVVKEKISLKQTLELREADLKQFKDYIDKQLKDVENMEDMKKELTSAKKLAKKNENQLQQNKEIICNQKKSLRTLHSKYKKMTVNLIEFGEILRREKLLSAKMEKILQQAQESYERRDSITDDMLNVSLEENITENQSLSDETGNDVTIPAYNDSLDIKKEENSPNSDDKTFNSYIKCGHNGMATSSPVTSDTVMDFNRSNPFCVFQNTGNQDMFQPAISSIKIEDASPNEELPDQEILFDKINNASPDSNFINVGSDSVCSEDISNEKFEQVQKGIMQLVLKTEDFAPLSPLPPSPSPKCSPHLTDNDVKDEIVNITDELVEPEKCVSDQENITSERPTEYSHKRNILSHQISEGFEPHAAENSENINSSTNQPAIEAEDISAILPPNLHYIGSYSNENNNFKIIHRGNSKYDYLVNDKNKLSVCVLTLPEENSLVSEMPSTSNSCSHSILPLKERIQSVLSVYNATEKRFTEIQSTISNSSQKILSSSSNEYLSRIIVIDDKDSSCKFDSCCSFQNAKNSFVMIKEDPLIATADDDDEGINETVKQDDNQACVSSSCDISPSKKKLPLNSFGSPKKAINNFTERVKLNGTLNLPCIKTIEKYNSSTETHHSNMLISNTEKSVSPHKIVKEIRSPLKSPYFIKEAHMNSELQSSVVKLSNASSVLNKATIEKCNSMQITNHVNKSKKEVKNNDTSEKVENLSSVVSDINNTSSPSKLKTFMGTKLENCHNCEKTNISHPKCGYINENKSKKDTLSPVLNKQETEKQNDMGCKVSPIKQSSVSENNMEYKSSPIKQLPVSENYVGCKSSPIKQLPVSENYVGCKSSPIKQLECKSSPIKQLPVSENYVGCKSSPIKQLPVSENYVGCKSSPIKQLECKSSPIKQLEYKSSPIKQLEYKSSPIEQLEYKSSPNKQSSVSPNNKNYKLSPIVQNCASDSDNIPGITKKSKSVRKRAIKRQNNQMVDSLPNIETANGRIKEPNCKGKPINENEYDSVLEGPSSKKQKSDSFEIHFQNELISSSHSDSTNHLFSSSTKHSPKNSEKLQQNEEKNELLGIKENPISCMQNYIVNDKSVLKLTVKRKNSKKRKKNVSNIAPIKNNSMKLNQQINKRLSDNSHENATGNKLSKKTNRRRKRGKGKRNNLSTPNLFSSDLKSHKSSLNFPERCNNVVAVDESLHKEISISKADTSIEKKIDENQQLQNITLNESPPKKLTKIEIPVENKKSINSQLPYEGLFKNPICFVPETSINNSDIEPKKSLCSPEKLNDLLINTNAVISANTKDSHSVNIIRKKINENAVHSISSSEHSEIHCDKNNANENKITVSAPDETSNALSVTSKDDLVFSSIVNSDKNMSPNVNGFAKIVKFSDKNCMPTSKTDFASNDFIVHSAKQLFDSSSVKLAETSVEFEVKEDVPEYKEDTIIYSPPTEIVNSEINETVNTPNENCNALSVINQNDLSFSKFAEKSEEKMFPKSNEVAENEILKDISPVSNLSSKGVGNEVPISNCDEMMNHSQVQGLKLNLRRSSWQSSISEDESDLVIVENVEEEENKSDLEICGEEVNEVIMTSDNKPSKQAKSKKRKAKTFANKKKLSRSSVEDESSNVVLSIANVLEEIDRTKIKDSLSINSHYKLQVHTLVNVLINPSNASSTVSALYQIFNHVRSSRLNPLMSFSIEQDKSVFYPFSEKCIVEALIQVEHKKKNHLKGLISTAITALYFLVLEKKSISKTGLGAFCRILTQLCKYAKNTKMPVRLCCDLIKTKHPLAPYLIASIVGVWSELFAITDETSDIELMLHRCIAYGVLKKPQTVNSTDWKQCKVLFSQYLTASPTHDVTEASKVLIHFIKKRFYCGSSEMDFIVIDPLVIFSTFESYDWVHQHLLSNFILPSLEKYAQEEENQRAFAILCELVAEIGLSSQEFKEPCTILGSFFQATKAHNYVKDCAARFVIKMVLLKKMDIPQHLYQWVQENENNLVGTPTEFLLKRRLMADSMTFTEGDIIS